jgi:hypothetical protein
MRSEHFFRSKIVCAQMNLLPFRHFQALRRRAKKLASPLLPTSKNAPIVPPSKLEEKAKRKADAKAAHKALRRQQEKEAFRLAASLRAQEAAEARMEELQQHNVEIEVEPPAVSLSLEERRSERREAALFAPPAIPVMPNFSSPDWQTSMVGRSSAELLKEDRKHYSRLAKFYGQVISETTLYNDHHSLTAGRIDWAEKWENCTGKRVLFFAMTDFSGSFYKWAEAINRHTAHAVRMISLVRHRYGYPLDLLYWRGDTLQRFPEVLNSILTLADQADIIHLKDQTGFLTGKNFLPRYIFRQFRKPMLYTLYGGTARKDEATPAYQRYVRSHEAVVAMTPDLCFDWVDSYFVPHNVDEDALPYSWRDGRLVMHTPSTPSRKGTSMFEAAAARISAKYGTQTEVITGVSHDYVMGHKRNGTIFFDQAGRESEANGAKLIGWYGNSALEAAVFGVPTIAHLSEEAIERANRADYAVETESAILNTHPSEDGLYDVLGEFFERSTQEREALSKATRAWIEKHHSYRSTAAKLSAIYESL